MSPLSSVDENSSENAFSSPRGQQCPQCNKRALFRSRARSLVDHVALLALLIPYRCRYCYHTELRFVFAPLASRFVDPQRR